jgi:hypothetical protein
LAEGVMVMGGFAVRALSAARASALVKPKWNWSA